MVWRRTLKLLGSHTHRAGHQDRGCGLEDTGSHQYSMHGVWFKMGVWYGGLPSKLGVGCGLWSKFDD